MRSLPLMARPQEGCDRQRVDAGAAFRLQPGLHRQARAEGVFQRQGSGFPLDQSRVAYLRYLLRNGSNHR
jgi:hypothetical protein